jgi:hypothetical protein
VATGPTFRWLLKADPDPEVAEVRAALRELTRRLEAAGWDRDGRGTDWWSRRFRWRGPEPPPTPSNPAPDQEMIHAA